MSSPQPPDAEAEIGVISERAEADPDAERLAGYDIACVRAANPGPLTLTGTNTWLLGRSPAWLVDPGPLLDSHLQRVGAEIEARGGLGGIALTHDHGDHAEAVAALRASYPAPLAAARGAADVQLHDGTRFGPFDALATPGHAEDHFSLIAGGACFTGDAVLGSGSVFISPHEGAMAGYLRALVRLRLREDFDVICPGHGPAVWEPQGKIDEYLAHRIDRENRLIAALGEGRRSVAELLDAVWYDVPEQLRGAAAVTLAAHLDKLEEEQILPRGVERPRFERVRW
ncbi:MAG TPA: MBL fold metallo-hydrolase [Solirubrobacteraceae bacterium]|nr:MBL fold metallo-hydrolase [Solirubrobacteraceae bacterium]